MLKDLKTGGNIGVVAESVLNIKAPFSRLSDVMNDLPDNVYLNKTTTGCGATHLCLTNDVNYVVLVPYISLINNKMKDENITNLFPVFGNVSVNEIVSYLKNTSNGVVGGSDDGCVSKIISTYDSFHKVVKALDMLDKVKDFKVCFDEAHSLISLSKIKGKVFNYFYNHFRRFKSFVFVTATPNDADLLPSNLSDVPFTRVVWENTVLVDIKEKHTETLAECNQLVVEVCKQHLLGEVKGNAYIFYNSVQEIVSVIKKLKKLDGFDAENVNIFCATNDRNNHKIANQLGVRFLKGSLFDCKKINFLTSTTYEGCDIKDMEGKTYIVVSSKRDSTALTNHILVPQICGRLRNSLYKKEAVMFVCGFNSDIYTQGKSHFLTKLEDMKSKAVYDIQRALKAKEDGYEDLFKEDMERFASSPFITEDENGLPTLNEDATKLEEQTYRAFNQHCITVESGYEIANTVRTYDQDMFSMSDITKLLIAKKVDYGRLMKQYIKAISVGDVNTIKTIEDYSEEHKRHVSVLGLEKIKAIGINKTKISNAYHLKLKFNENNFKIKQNLSGVRVGERYLLSDITDKLKVSYKKVGIEKKPKSTDIKNFFSVKDVFVTKDGKRSKGYLILDDLYKENV